MSSDKCHISNVLNEAAAIIVKRGFDVDRFMDPVQPDKTDAIFVKGPNLLIFKHHIRLRLNRRISVARHHVISFYDVYDEEKLREN